jgi:hypothetical protein
MRDDFNSSYGESYSTREKVLLRDTHMNLATKLPHRHNASAPHVYTVISDDAVLQTKVASLATRCGVNLRVDNPQELADFLFAALKTKPKDMKILNISKEIGVMQAHVSAGKIDKPTLDAHYDAQIERRRAAEAAAEEVRRKAAADAAKKAEEQAARARASELEAAQEVASAPVEEEATGFFGKIGRIFGRS